MTIEQKALELVNAVKRERGGTALGAYYGWAEDRPETVALIRALEAHEADKSRHAAELREQAERFSEAAKEAVRLIDACMGGKAREVLSPFILAPVDPLAECFAEIGWSTESPNGYRPDRLRAALDARGLHIVAKGGE